MEYKEDLEENNRYGQANLLTPLVPNLDMKGNGIAFYAQRTEVPKGFKGVVKGVLLPGEDALTIYVDRPYLSNTTDITVKNGDRVLISGNGNIQLWAATEGQSFTISDIGNKLKALVPSVLRSPEYTIEGEAEDLELNSIGSAWGGGAHDENTLLFICDSNKNWRVGG